MAEIAVALVHYPVMGRGDASAVTAVTPIDVHDFARSCAFYGVGPVYLVHPAEGMQQLVRDMLDYYLHGAGAVRNPDRAEVLSAVRIVSCLEDVVSEGDYRLWYTSATPPGAVCTRPEELARMPGKQLIVFGTGQGLDVKKLPDANGWLSPIEGAGKVRHLSVRAALAIYLDRLALV
ncbi:hypothetical protein FE236_09940 [Mariprofundus erugo]|uniref:tRNA (guanine-N(1)-)-methyltransferase C-terminal domain-containing protein n=1 Tax=Mariprofundus erugo TaxID=2528639 RepID=A0A5R9GW65_9PROT|nr:RNA methyltransferase [Mariprofundus erugo]TLS68979.1 hypothetical protein FEF65_00315 [Mariprofundus erugo]TLS75273.1 hypothetical protein FE236_09940 [Mariprofundus erugo]